MHNLDTVSKIALQSAEEGYTFSILIVRCLKTGGRFISVRSVSPAAFVSGLQACAKDRNFGAYNSPILESIRKFGVDGHSISFDSAYATRKEANAAKKELVERQALNRPEVNLNYNRPVKGQTESDFRWLSEEEVAAKLAAKRARQRAAKAAASATSTEEAAA